MTNNLGKTLLIYNPVSQNGNGEAIAIQTIRMLRETYGFCPTVRWTTRSKHGTELAADAGDFDTVIALGGDGLVHEVVNGLMAIPEDIRPRFGLIPVGSGNDFAHTLGLDKDFGKAVGQLFSGAEAVIDIGRCNDEYFAESVSFGLDAAIALETMDRRKRTGRTGTMLYLTSGLDQLKNHYYSYSYDMNLPSGQKTGEMLLLAVQNGPTYGGGFEICPDATPTDGMLNVCIAKAPLNQLKAILIFLLAKGGHHTRFKQIGFLETPSLSICFDKNVPAQIDGEELLGKDFDIEVLPSQLRVIASKIR